MSVKKKAPPRRVSLAAPASGARAPTKESKEGNLPAVSKQTAGGIAGAMVGGIVAGPVGAIVGGVAGAMVGNSSAAGERPIGRTVDNIRSVTEKPARKAYARISKAMKPSRASKKKASTKKASGKKPAAKKIPKKRSHHASA